MSTSSTAGDDKMRGYGVTQNVPTFDDPAVTPLDKPLSDARVAT